MPVQAHLVGEGYSEQNPVPTIQSFRAEQEKEQKQLEEQEQQEQSPSPQQGSLDKSLPSTPFEHVSKDEVPPAGVDGDEFEPKKRQKTAAEEKKEMMERMQPPKGASPLDRAKDKGGRWERDPVTGTQVLIKNPEFKDYKKEDYASVKALPKDERKQDTRFPAPTVSEVSNICIQPFPPPLDPVDTSHVVQILRTGAQVVSAACAVVWYFVATGRSVSWFSFFFRTSLIGSVAVLAWIGAENTVRKITKELERIRTHMHTQRGQKYSPPTPESVEWMNALVKLVWGLVNPDMFIPIVDMVEDVLQASLPGFISAVRIADIGQGTNPLRIVSMRALPDQPHDKEYPREEWVGMDREKTTFLNPEAAKDDEGQTGDYLNYEVSVSYQAQPSQSKRLRFHNMHLTLEFFLGAYDWFKIPIPIYAIVEGFVCTARMRLQLVQNPPFVRNVTVSLMSVPKVEVSVEPFTKLLPNVLDLPFIQKFVEMGIAAAAAQYVAPKSLTLNLAEMLTGDGVKRDTRALGVLVINVRHAVDLSAQDKRTNSSDPYIVLAYAKFGKPLYSTRIICGDLNPVWEETAFLLVTDEEIKAEESVSATLWDWDRGSADDLVGRVSVPLLDILKHPNVMMKRSDKLVGFEAANEMPGELVWEIGFFDKMPLNRALMIPDPKKEATLDPQEVLKKEDMQANPSPTATAEEVDVNRTPPDPAVPCGILSVIVHQINNLERQDIKGVTGSGEGKAGQDTSNPAEEGENLPNAYCEIILNDDMIYKTRVKQYSSMPYFEAGTERFVRNWQETVVRVQVRDARTRERDPVLGIVTVKLSELFRNSSEVTRLFSLQEGVGFGRANISFLLRQVKLDIPRSLLGWETGTVEVLNRITLTPTPEFSAGFSSKKLSLSTTETSYRAPSSSAHVDLQSGSVSWLLPNESVRLPVYNRYASAVTFEIGGGGLPFVGPDSDFVACVWLRDLVDHEETEVNVPVIKSDKLAQVRQNYINEQTARTHKYEIVGYLNCKLVVDAGLDPDHEKMQHSRPDRHRYEAYDRVEGAAQIAERNSHFKDDGVIDRKERKALDAEKRHQLHMRHRGVMQHKAARTAVWSAQGVKKRARTIKMAIIGNKARETHVESEV